MILGFQVHTGWAIRVAVTGRYPNFEIVDRARVELLPDDIQRFACHEAAEMKLDEAARLIAKVKQAARKSAREAIDVQGWRVAAIAVPGKPSAFDKALAEILASHSLIHAAEGVLYREAIELAAGDYKVRVVTVPEKEIWALAAARFGTVEAQLRARMSAMKKILGSPWAADHQVATLAALMAQ